MFLLITVLGLLNPGLAIRCLECQDMPTPYDCQNVVDCLDTDACFVDQFVTSSGYILFNQGCRSKLRCVSTTKRSNDDVVKHAVYEVKQASPDVKLASTDVRRASTDIPTCEECCSGDFCNQQGCGIQVPPRNARGPFCFNCDAQFGTDKCRKIKTCAADEACVVLNTTDSTTPSGQFNFQTGCIYITQCHVLEASFVLDTSLVAGQSTVHQCPFCCRDDFCNDNCIHNVTIATTLAPIDGQWSSWGHWGQCSTTCGPGEHARVRSCDSPAPQHNGQQCVGDNLNTAICSVRQCPVNGQWSPWSQWQPCDVTCGHGSTSRTRTCDHPAPQNGGLACPGDTTETHPCNTQTPCPVNGQWSPWSAWQPCDVTCGHGTESRTRSCDDPAPQNGGMTCPGDTRQTQACNTHTACPVNGQWSPWSAWQPCDVTCGHGTESRTRSCDHPAPQNGGHRCWGNTTDTQACFTHTPCPVNGQWSQWTSWQPCDVTCGHGTESRTRSCNHPAPQNGGQACPGDNTETHACNTHTPCPVDGQWSTWHQWSSCSVTCGQGTMSRSRACNSPAPAHGGHNCAGDNSATDTCTGGPCPVDGAWSQWSHWRPCSSQCGHGTYDRTRTCDHPAPAYGGSDCVGPTSQSQPCHGNNCVTNGWSEWESWSSCSRTCGHSYRHRTRTCANGGTVLNSNCPGQAMESEYCHVPACAVNGYWAHWLQWSACSATCGEANQTRTRFCHAPQHGGQPCVGEVSQTMECKQEACLVSVNGHWSLWSPWSRCNVLCGTGHQTRYRYCNNPSPSNGGHNCVGVPNDRQSCDMGTCVDVNGGWGPWSPWSHCRVTCSDHAVTTYRHRSCDNPPPQNNGTRCIGQSSMQTRCHGIHPCPTVAQTGTCKSGLFYDSIIGCYKYSTTYQPHSIAEQDCHRNGMHLLTIHDIQTENHVYQLIRDHHDHFHPVWLGIQWDGNQWMWNNEKSLTTHDFNNVYLHMFVDGTDLKRCMVKQEYWNPTSCDEPNPYICVF